VNHYEVLGLAPAAPPEEVRQAYLRLARRHHPDRAGGDAERMREVNEAWTVLGDPARRALYDLTLPGPAAPPVGGSSSLVRPGYEPDPRYDPFDDVAAGEGEEGVWGWSAGMDPEDRPFGPPIVLPRWLRLVPAGTFATSVATTVVATILTSGPLLAFGLMLFVLACVFFLAAPFMALLTARRGDPRHRDL